MSAALRVVLILLAASLIAGAVTGTTVYYRLVYIWVLILLVSFLMSALALRGVRLRRTSRTLRSQVGQIFEERYEIQNTGRLARLWIEVRDESKLPGAQGSHVMTLINGRESRSYLARTRLTRRGVFPLGPTALVSGDLFGLFPTQRNFVSADSLLVYPMVFEVTHFPNPPGLLPGGEALRRRTAQITSNAAGVREYYSGDPLNRIHWLSTARRNQLMVKEFELDPLADVWILLDAYKHVHAARQVPEDSFALQDYWKKRLKYELPPATIEYAVSSAASLARYYISRDRAVGLALADTSMHALPSDRSGRQLGKILEALALVTPEGGLPLQGLVEAQARYLPRGSTVILITPSSSQIIYKSADLLLRRGLRPVVVLINGATFGGTGDTASLFQTLQTMTIPSCQINYGDDLTLVLSEIASRPNWGYRSD